MDTPTYPFEETSFMDGPYCKAKKNFGAIRKILKFFIFGNLHHKKGHCTTDMTEYES